MLHSCQKKRPHCHSIAPAGNAESVLALSLGGYHLNLHQSALGEVANGESRTSGIRLLEELGIYLVHGTKVGDVAQQHGGFHHVVQVKTSTLEDCLSIEKRLASLLRQEPQRCSKLFSLR